MNGATAGYAKLFTPGVHYTEIPWLLAEALVKLSDAGDDATVRGLMRHEFFGPMVIRYMLHFARDPKGFESSASVDGLSAKVRSLLDELARRQADDASRESEQAAKDQAKKEKNKQQTAPARKARSDKAKGMQVKAVLNRMRASGANINARNLATALGKQYGIGAAAVRKLRNEILNPKIDQSPKRKRA